jgi:beta-phosphoglucomutase-like phosphatase (HAD superfamily)
MSKVGKSFSFYRDQKKLSSGSRMLVTVLLSEIAQVGGKIERVYYCPHNKDENCCCRKPRPGMLFRARDELGIDMKDAIFVGDSISDMRAGLAAGAYPILVLTGLGKEQLPERIHEADGPFCITMSLEHAAEIILQRLYDDEDKKSQETNPRDIGQAGKANHKNNGRSSGEYGQVNPGSTN